jgi:hypothetical protein
MSCAAELIRPELGRPQARMAVSCSMIFGQSASVSPALFAEAGEARSNRVSDTLMLILYQEQARQVQPDSASRG